MTEEEDATQNAGGSLVSWKEAGLPGQLDLALSPAGAGTRVWKWRGAPSVQEVALRLAIAQLATVFLAPSTVQALFEVFHRCYSI